MNFDIDLYNPFKIKSEESFNELALEIFQFQYKNNLVYRKYVDCFGRNSPLHYSEIPFLPIEFFKSNNVICGDGLVDLKFRSSGTSGANSVHHVKDKIIYESSFSNGIKIAYADIKDRVILALLPNYLEQGSSSLVYMADSLIKRSKFKESGFYLGDIDALISVLEELERRKQPTLLLRVSFALLDLVEKKNFNLTYTNIIETGGMKGRRKEMVRSELHLILCNGFGVSEIHSEYGMTELLSQAYSKGNGIFNCPPWMKIQIRDINDPLELLANQRSGGINVIDLANIYSCSFIATQDLGQTFKNGSFEVIGRFDNTDVRGYNLMML